ncbi:MAG: ABC transporter ATP-binding protein, partial [Actinomycetota bacterium]
MTDLIEARDIRQDYAGAFSLRVSHVSADRGTVLCLLGPSGAGKSTLLRILGLLERPGSGVVTFDGRVVGPRMLFQRRRTASSLQEQALLRGRAITNVEYGLRCRRVGRRAARVRAEQALAEVGLDGMEERSVTDLSGGQRQRVNLARVLAVEPEILLLDEPLALIDEPRRESLASGLREFTLRTGCATIWVTHDRAEALGVADRLALIDDGDLVEFGDAMRVFSQPSSEKAARLVGADNLIPGTIADSAGGLARINAGGFLIEAVSSLPEGSEVLVTIRPESIALWARRP